MSQIRINSSLIRTKRKEKAWSQSNLAEAAGLSLSTIQKIETTSSATNGSARKVALALGVSVDNLAEHPPTDSGKRKFLGILGGVVLGAVGSQLGGLDLALAYHSLEKNIQKYRGRVGLEYVQHLFPMGGKFDIGACHPDVLGTHPDNSFVAMTLGASGSENYFVGDTKSGLDGTIIAIGSPTASAIAQRTFGFSGNSSFPPPNPWDLPVTFAQGDDSNTIITRRWLNGVDHRSRQRGIWHRGEQYPTLISLKAENRQADDYLLITVLPNYFDKQSALSASGRIWHIGGVHGIGTKAFIELFHNDHLIGNLVEYSRKSEFFQVLYHIEGVIHDDEDRVSKPTRVIEEHHWPLDRSEYRDRAIAFGSRTHWGT
jgi:transcriptional regulator with XRE-family HTH domain